MLSSSIIENNLIYSYTSQYMQPPMDIYEKGQNLFTTDLRVNEKIVQIPVRSRNCYGHTQWSFDLLDIYEQSSNKKIRCPICDVEFTSQDIILDNYWYSFIRQFNKRCQIIVIIKDFCYQKVFRQMKYTKQLENNQDLIYLLYQRRDQQYNFKKLMEQDRFIDGQLNQLKFSAVCLHDNVKLYIPVRYKDCKHIGAYDLSSLLCHFNEVIGLQQKAEKEKLDNNQQQLQEQQQQLQIKKVYQCRQPGCNVKINYDLNELKQNLVLDNELLQAIKISHPSAINFQIKNKLGVITFEDEFTNEKDQFIRNLWDKMPRETQNLYPIPPTVKVRVPNYYKEFFSAILDNFQRIFSNQDEQKVLKGFLQSFKYQTHQIPLFDNIANKIIEYPARCIECKDRKKCLDLRTLISILLNQKKQEPEKLGIQCPICNFNHMPKKPRNSILINNYLYLDNQLLAQMIRDDSYRYLQNNILQYDGRKIMLEEYTRNQVITIEQSKEQSNFNNGIIQYFSMKCNGTDNLLRDPLVLVKCPTQNRFSFNYVYEVFQNSGFKSNDLVICTCRVCKQSKQDIQDLYYDEFLAHIIPRIPKNYDICKPVKYDIQNDCFIIESEPKPFTRDVMGIHVVSNKEGTKIENQQSLLNKYDKIAKNVQYKKWNLNISNIKFKVDIKKIEQ